MKERTVSGPAGGFTLVELMLVIGIIGVLAAIAVPAFQKYVEKTKSTEVHDMFNAMHKGLLGYWESEFVVDSDVGSELKTHCMLLTVSSPMPDISTMEPDKKYFVDFSTNDTFREMGLASEMYSHAWAFVGADPIHDCMGGNLSAYEGQLSAMYQAVRPVQTGTTWYYYVLPAGIVGGQLVRGEGIRSWGPLTMAEIVDRVGWVMAGN